MKHELNPPEVPDQETLGVDADRTAERTSAGNLSNMQTWVNSILRHVDIGRKASMRRKD